MKKYIRHTALSLVMLILSSALIAQDAQTAAPKTDQPAAATDKPCHMNMKDYCTKMMQPPKKGFKHSIEWGGIYGGPQNQVTYRMFGRTIHQDMRERNAVRMSAGYLFNPYFYFGGGMGAEFQRLAYTNRTSADVSIPQQPYNTVSYTGSMVVIPIYADVRGYLLNKKISPFLQHRMGYAPVVYVGAGQRTVEHALYDNMSIGVRIFSHMSITAGYLFMYQPTSVSGYDERNSNRPILDQSNPFQHRVTVGIAMGM